MADILVVRVCWNDNALNTQCSNKRTKFQFSIETAAILFFLCVCFCVLVACYLMHQKTHFFGPNLDDVATRFGIFVVGSHLNIRE